MYLSKTDRELLSNTPKGGCPYLTAFGGMRVANSARKLAKAGRIKVLKAETDYSAPPLGYRKTFSIELRYIVL